MKTEKCQMPMWMNGLPAGVCGEDAYGPQELNQKRSGNYIDGRFVQLVCSGSACYRHGGPKELINCEVCGENFNPLNLDEVAYHCIDHSTRPDIQYSGGRKLESEAK